MRIAGLLSVVLVAGLAWGLTVHAPEPEPAAPAPTSARESPSRPVAQTPVAPPPASLEGAAEDGAWPLDRAGHLRLGAEVRRRIEYVLSGVGEESEVVALARLRAEAGALSAPAREEALALLERFARYRARGRALASAAPADPEARLAAIHALRREVFGADAEALFGDEEAADRVALAQRWVLQEPGLEPAERQRQLDALEAQRPPEQQAARAATRAVVERVAEEAELRRQGATAEDIHQVRVQSLGVEAAGRLDALDQARVDWSRRVQAFEAERAQLSADDAERLLQSSFTPTEQLRVRALERAAQ